MKNAILILLLSCSVSFGQIGLNKNLKVDDGAYTLYCAPNQHSWDKIRNQLYNWYVKDENTIVEIYKIFQLVPRKTFDLFSEPYDVEMLLCKNKECVERYYINSSKQNLYYMDKSYSYSLPDLEKVSAIVIPQSINGGQRIMNKRLTLDDIKLDQEQLLKDTNVLLITESYINGNYEGFFDITVPVKGKFSSVGISTLEQKLKKEISKKYKDSVELSLHEYFGDDTVYVTLYGSKKLHDRFKLYPIYDWMGEGDTWTSMWYTIKYFNPSGAPIPWRD